MDFLLAEADKDSKGMIDPVSFCQSFLQPSKVRILSPPPSFFSSFLSSSLLRFFSSLFFSFFHFYHLLPHFFIFPLTVTLSVIIILSPKLRYKHLDGGAKSFKWPKSWGSCRTPVYRLNFDASENERGKKKTILHDD